MPALAARVPLHLLCGRGTVTVMRVIMAVMTISAAASAVLRLRSMGAVPIVLRSRVTGPRMSLMPMSLLSFGFVVRVAVTR